MCVCVCVCVCVQAPQLQAPPCEDECCVPCKVSHSVLGKRGGLKASAQEERGDPSTVR